MNTEVIQKEILSMEQKYWQAMKDNDLETAVSLTHFPCLVSGPAGTQKVTEEQYREMMGNMSGDKFKNVQIASPEVEFLNDQTAVISYSTEVNGMNMLDISTWIKYGDKWLCAFHSENPRKLDSLH